MSASMGHQAAALRPYDAPKPVTDSLAEGGEMEALIRAHDWAKTPLGPCDGWSQSLKMMVSFLLANRFPLLLWWGPRYIQIYNDPYRPVLGTKHPRSLGEPCSECWAEIWHVLKPLIDTPFQGGPPTWMEDLELELHRHGFTEESHFTIAYSPVPDETAPCGIGGVLATVHEITEKVIGERRIVALRDLGTRSAEAKTAEEACVAAVEILSRTPKDVPFAVLYLVDRDGKTARRVAATGFPDGAAAGPGTVHLNEAAHDCIWPLADALRADAMITVEDLPSRLAEPPPGPWSDPPHCAVVVPIRSNTAHQLAGLLVAGVSSRLRLNEQYRSFFELAAAQIATTIANARAYEEERRRAEALAEIDRAKTAFFSNVSHEFRTPLTLMLGPLEEAAAHPLTPAPVRAQLELAQRNSLRLLKLVNSLLDFSRIEAGRAQASYEPTDVSAVTRDLASTFRSAMERAGLELIVECETLEEPVYLDREMWEKIVLNLLSNAFKFTLEGSVAVRLHRQGSSAELEVSDTGVGIPEVELPRVFERFHRVEGTAGRTQEGSGIGLALVQELVKLHGGTVAVTSRLGIGTTFRVRIPLGNVHLPAERIKAPRALASTAIGVQAFVQEALRWIPGGEPSSRLTMLGDESVADVAHRSEQAGGRILLADDNADMRAYVSDLLAPTYQVESVADGEQALEAARRERPDLILSDIMMPRVDGLALLAAVRADERLRDVPVILLSARAGEEARVEGLEAGADDYLVKPFSARELLARVGGRLELMRMRRRAEESLRERENALTQAHAELQRRTAELARFNHAAVGRETRIIELKREINALRERLGEGPRYALEFDAQPPASAAHCEEGGGALAPLGAILRTEQLLERPSRPPDHEKENRALRELVQALADSPRTILQALADKVLQVLDAGSAGLSLLTDDGERFYWAAIAGAWSPHLGGGTPRGFGPCGDVLDRNAPLLFTHWEQRYPYLSTATPLAEEGLLVPFHVGGRAVGTIWVISHDAQRRFDAEDLRQLESLGRFAAAAYQAVEFLGAIEQRRAALNLMEDAVQARQIAEESNRRLRESEELLRETDRRKNEFLALLGHELRNPIAPISTAGELLSRTLADDQRSRVAIDMIKRQAAQLTRLVDDLLDIGRITQGRVQLRRKPLELASVIQQAVETVEPQLRQKRHKVAIVSSYEPLYVSGDFARLVQCVVNVLTNAAKYTDAQGQIRVETRAESSSAIVEVADDGAGIAPELLPKIFDLFVQSDRTLDRAQGGLGIGLSIAKRLIEMHEGEITARSPGLGRGSTFEIRLPRIAPPVVAPEAANFKAPPRRVLIVDDNVDAATSLSLLLAVAGHETRVASSSEAALEHIESFQPEVALLDIGLPEMNGYELAHRLRAIPRLRGTRLVALTGYGQAEDRQRALAAGFDDHLVKPVDLPALERTLAGISAEGAAAAASCLPDPPDGQISARLRAQGAPNER